MSAAGPLEGASPVADGITRREEGQPPATALAGSVLTIAMTWPSDRGVPSVIASAMLDGDKPRSPTASTRKFR